MTGSRTRHMLHDGDSMLYSHGRFSQNATAVGCADVVETNVIRTTHGQDAMSQLYSYK